MAEEHSEREMHKDNGNRSAKPLEVSRTDIILMIVGFGAGAFVSWIIRSMMAGKTLLNVLTCLALLLHIFSLLAFLLRKLSPFLFGFTFVFSIFVSIILVKEFIINAVPLIFLSLLAFLVSMSSSSSITSYTSAELLGGLYTWIFIAQLAFYIGLVYENKADINVRGLSLFLDIISSSAIIYKIDQRIRFGVSCFTKARLGKNNTHAGSFMYAIEKILHKTVYLVKPVIEDLENSIFLGILASLLLVPLAPLIPASLTSLISTVSSFIAAAVFLVRIGARLRRECNIDLMISLYSIFPQFNQLKQRFIIKLSFFIAIIAAVIIAYKLVTSLNPLISLTVILLMLVPLIILFIIFMSLIFFTVPFTLAFAIGNVVNIIECRSSPTELINETMISNLIFSSSVFMAFILFALITCLRHDMDAKQQADGWKYDLRALEP